MMFWQSNSEFAPWALAWVYWIWPHDLLLLWLQAIGVVAAEAVAFKWICELAGHHPRRETAAWLASVGLLLFAANPWIWWSISWDFHEEALSIPLLVLMARDLANGRRRVWVWVAPVLATGAPAATYLAGLGAGGILKGRRSRVPGAILAMIGVGYSLLIVFIHGDLGAPLARHYGYLAASAAAGSAAGKLTFGALAKGIASHPLRLLQALWAKRVDVLAKLAPAGLLGLASLLLLPLLLVVLLTDILSAGYIYAEPVFQDLPIYILLPVGTVAVLGWFARRNRRTAILLAGLVVTQALCWTAVWGPQTFSQWLRVSGPAAATLAGLTARIPASAEVIASQGVVGRFSGRRQLYDVRGPGPWPITGSDVWFIITPQAGVEVQTEAAALALIGQLAGPLHATLVTHANGVWAFRWRPPPQVHSVIVPAGTAPIPAWASPGAAGRDVLTGPVSGWHVTAAGARGYICDGLTWQEPSGRYQASVTLSATGPVNVEVWNDTGNILLARRSIPGTNGVESVSMPVNATTAYRASSYSGWGPFRGPLRPAGTGTAARGPGMVPWRRDRQRLPS